jgi:glucose/arabinose dehydrogenase
MRTVAVFLAIVMAGGACSRRSVAAPPLPLDSLHLPPGFHVSVFAHPVPGARSLARGDGGTVFVGSRKQGVVYGLIDADGDGKTEAVRRIAGGLDTPNGVAFRDGALYVAEVGRILRYDAIEKRLENPPAPVVVTDAYPKDAHHGWKFVAFGPDGLLYVPVGAPCNICRRDDPVYASITRIRPDGGGREVIAHGVRNSVGFDWHPSTRELWFTDNGRDMLGDDRPPDELNRLARVGQHFGYPHCHGASLPDPDLNAGRPCAEFTAPVLELGAHVAAIGMRFYAGTAFPPEYQGAAVVAEHGSWNRSRKSGYRVMVARFRDGRPVSYEPLVEGWLRGEQAWGRPVDVLNLPDGSLLVSDDLAGAVYRVAYGR